MPVSLILTGFMSWFIFIFLGIYGYVISRCLAAWKTLPVVQPPATHIPQTSLSLIIPVRNEQANILFLLEDLTRQQYPVLLFEVIVVDDYSEDETAQLVQTYAETAPYCLCYMSLQNISKQSGKKAAIAASVAQATGELLVFTDGDCRVQANWLLYLEYFYREKKAKFISGPVSFHQPVNIFEKMQLLEFASLIGVGAASLALKMPNMCNGANIAYPKQVFAEVNGFAGNEHIASGDDEFLLHKIFKKYPESVYFLKASGATVYTSAKNTIKDFISQRVRWASKWPAYNQAAPKLLALLVFSTNFLLLLYFILLISTPVSVWVFVAAFSFKCVIDSLFLRPVLAFFQKEHYGKYIILLQLVYVPYVVITALAAWRSSYTWKNRKIYK